MPDSHITSLLSLRQTLLGILLSFGSQDIKEPLLLILTLNFPGWLLVEVFTGFSGKGRCEGGEVTFPAPRTKFENCHLVLCRILTSVIFLVKKKNPLRILKTLKHSVLP